ncbi:MAG: TonB-dependent receptor, partial [Chitinophagia bacterium]|nr:TonB-dependent receptor [Chitinophagia bacterium]
MRLLFLSTIFFFFASCPLWAQSDSAEANSPDEANVAGMGDTNAIKNIPLLPVLVHSVRASNNAPFAKTEISKEEIARQNLGQDLPVLLQLTPSAVVNTDAGAGVGYTGIRIRGTDPARINVTLNGIPVNDPEEQGAFFVDFPDVASSTNSIQIQRGVGSSTNGTGAFGATISINNNTVSEVAGASISSSAGSFNTFKNTLQASTGRMANKLALDVRLSQITSDGYIERSASRLQSLQVNADYSISSNTSLKFMMMQGKEKTGQAWNGVYQDSLNTNRRYNELGQKPDSSFYNNQTDNYIQNYY